MSLFSEYHKIQTQEMPIDNLRMTTRQRKKQYRKLAQKDMAKTHLYPLPKLHEAVYMVSNARFDFYDFIPAMIEIKGMPATRLLASTWIMNRININGLIELFDKGQVKAIDFFIGEYFKKRESANYALFAEFMINRCQRFKCGKNHSKFFSIQFEDGECYTIQSSANFTENGNVETHVCENDPDLFAFHYSWMNEILKHNG